MASVASSDDGEIRSVGRGEKATKSLSQYDGTSIDRPDRNRSSTSTSRSPEHSHRSRDGRSHERSRSPYSDRNPRGSKRARDDDYNDRPRGDRRIFQVRYEDGPQEYKRRPRVAYEDLDQGPPSSSNLQYDDRDRRSDKRPRTRSRSPYRAGRSEDRYNRAGQPRRDDHRRRDYERGENDDNRRTNPQLNGNVRNWERKDQSVSKRGPSPLPADNTKQEAKSTQGNPQKRQHAKQHSNIESKQANEPDQAPAVDFPKEEPLDEAALIEQRRKRREAIKAKYRGSATPLLVQALQLGDKSGESTPGQKDITPSALSTPPESTPSPPADPQDIGSPAVFDISSDQDLANTIGYSTKSDDHDSPSAADYDPTMDMREDKVRDDQRHTDEVSSRVYDETKPTTEQDVLLPIEEVEAVEESPKKAKDEFDMFAEDDDDDMFAEEVVPDKPKAEAVVAKAVPIPQARELDIGMLDNWDDPEGYYKVILGELLNGRYHVQSNLGRGMFSGVVRAEDSVTKKPVAIKLIRNNDTMRKAGLKEIEILQKINEADPEDKKHMIRLERHFEHKGHLCMVFENLSINLREVLKKFGRDVGINIRAVRIYAQQMLLGLSLMKKCNILHADLKPDNILVNESRNMLKICDLGSASDASDNEITPYLVSRFYRAPEIILGMPYDFAIDMWSVGCTLYELYTGKILFTGRTNNQMIRSIIETRGKFTTKMLKRAQFAHMHFDEMANFISIEQDKITGKDTIKTMAFSKPTRDLRTRLMSAAKGLSDIETKELALFTDLIERCLALNPEKRITPNEALKHPFILRSLR